MLIAAENPGVALDYGLIAKGAVDSSFVDAGSMPFTPLFSTTAALGVAWTASSLVLSGPSAELESHTADEVRQGLGLMLVVSAAGREWISYQTAVAGNSTTATLGLVNRGLFGAVPLAHPPSRRSCAGCV